MGKRGGAPTHGDEDRIGRAFDRRLFARLLGHALPFRRPMAAVVVLILGTTALDLVGPFIVKWVIDGPLRGSLEAGSTGEGTGALMGSGAGQALAGAALLYLCVTAALFILRYLQGISMATIGQGVMRDLRTRLFSHMQDLPVAWFDRNPVGRLTTRVTSDIEALNQLFASGVVTFIADILVLVGITGALVWINGSLALVTLLSLPPLLLVTGVFRRAAQKYYRQTRSLLAQLSGFTQESLQGMPVIQLFTREPENGRRFRRINESYLDAFQKTVLCYALYFPAVEFIAAGALALILWRGGMGLRTGTLTFGEFYLFWSFLGRFMSPVRDMAERYNVLQSAMAAAERVFKILDEPVAAHNAISAGSSAASGGLRLRGEVEFQDVWFAYMTKDGEEHQALRGISFKVRPGETLAIVGATGAGKSTLASLLARFHEPQRGRILVDGKDIREIPFDRYRHRIGVVLQDPFLFSRSIRDNIRLDRPWVGDEAVGAAARRTNTDGFISRLPGGFDAVLGERGAGLSAGEKQLLTFARALAGDPDILILDEATSHVDAATEALIRAAVGQLLAGRTSIVIAHRLSTIREAGRIIVLHKGELREMGTHRELLERRGIYHRLYMLQIDPASTAALGPSPALREAMEAGEERPPWPAGLSGNGDPAE